MELRDKLRAVLSKSRFRTLAAFGRKKERLVSGCFFVDGWRWLEEALRLPGPPECVLALEGAARSPEESALLATARRVAKEFHEATAVQLTRLTGSVQPPGVAVLIRWSPSAFEPAEMSGDPALIVGLDSVGDPGNAGTIVRTADWFRAACVVFGSETVEPTNPKLVRATMGSLLHLPVCETPSLPRELGRAGEAGYVGVGAVLGGTPLPDFVWPRRAFLVVGNEANGIRPEVQAALEHRVTIPAHGHAESLNAAVAAGILMADWRSRVDRKG